MNNECKQTADNCHETLLASLAKFQNETFLGISKHCVTLPFVFLQNLQAKECNPTQVDQE